MINPNITYEVNGRYMDGQKVIGYHLVGKDGSESQENKDRVIWLIGKGIITNMRIQTGNDGEVIIRGKGVNLNNLPVYDPVKDRYRSNGVVQHGINYAVPTKKAPVKNIDITGQYTITHRIMYKNNCIGYQLVDYKGKATRKQRDDVKKLAIQKLISNATVNRYTKQETGKTELILRGVNCELNKLPILVVDSNGKIVDPTQNKSKFTVRIAYMKRSGIIRDTVRNKETRFKAGDVIVCEASGDINIMDSITAKKTYTRDTESAHAFCDDYLEIASNCYIEVFGDKPIQLNARTINGWAIMKPRTA